MPNYIVQGSDLSTVASAIRTKGSTSEQLAFPTGFVSAIEAIPTGELGEFTLLNTINASEAVSSVSLTIPSGYTEIAISYSVEMSASSRLYFYFNSVATSRLLDQSGSGSEKSGMFVIQRLEAVTLDNFTATEKTVAHTSSDQASAPISFAYPPSSILCVPSTQGATITGSFKIYGR